MSRVLGLDYGERRLGFALSDPDGIVAMPFAVVTAETGKARVREVLRLCRETGAARLVVGLPQNMNGTLGPAAQAVLTFVDRLREAADIPVETWDERLSTRAAERVLIEAGTSRRKRKRAVDKLAAQIMLQGYLDARQN